MVADKQRSRRHIADLSITRIARACNILPDQCRLRASRCASSIKGKITATVLIHQNEQADADNGQPAQNIELVFSFQRTVNKKYAHFRKERQAAFNRQHTPTFPATHSELVAPCAQVAKISTGSSSVHHAAGPRQAVRAPCSAEKGLVAFSSASVEERLARLGSAPQRRLQHGPVTADCPVRQRGRNAGSARHIRGRNISACCRAGR